MGYQSWLDEVSVKDLLTHPPQVQSHVNNRPKWLQISSSKIIFIFPDILMDSVLISRKEKTPRKHSYGLISTSFIISII